jgi:hypothetical protein
MLGRAAEAEPLYKDAWARHRRLSGDDHPTTISLLNNYADVLVSLGRAAEAEPLAREALAKALARASLGPAHPLTRVVAATHAEALDALARHDEAAAVRRRFGLPQAQPQPMTLPATRPSMD